MNLFRTFLHVPRNLLIGAVRLYQFLLSPVLGGSCRFVPSCSEYAVLALRKYGAVRGSILAVWRILRCNPFNHSHPYDPPRWFGEPRPQPELED